MSHKLFYLLRCWKPKSSISTQKVNSKQVSNSWVSLNHQLITSTSASIGIYDLFCFEAQHNRFAQQITALSVDDCSSIRCWFSEHKQATKKFICSCVADKLSHHHREHCTTEVHRHCTALTIFATKQALNLLNSRSRTTTQYCCRCCLFSVVGFASNVSHLVHVREANRYRIRYIDTRLSLSLSPYTYQFTFAGT